MDKIVKDINLLNKTSPDMGGVYSINDLQALLGEENKILMYRRINKLEQNGLLRRFKRGIYVTPGYNPEVLCMRINSDSYISLSTVLSETLIIGSVPSKTLYSIKKGKRRVYSDSEIKLVYTGIKNELFFGYSEKDGIKRATPEKALLDTLYLYQLGTVFSFNIYEDIDISRIDREALLKWLEIYKNPCFKSFAREYINDRT